MTAENAINPVRISENYGRIGSALQSMFKQISAFLFGVTYFIYTCSITYRVTNIEFEISIQVFGSPDVDSFRIPAIPLVNQRCRSNNLGLFIVSWSPLGFVLWCN